MFCEKCGKPNDDDALFCEYCGASLADEQEAAPAAPAPNPAPVQVSMQAPAPAQAPVYAAPAPAPKKRGKAGFIAAIISAAAVAIAAVIYVVFFLNKSSKPTLTGKPAMTVNGKNVPVSLVCRGYAGEGVFIGGKADNELFYVVIAKEFSIQENTTINDTDGNIGFFYSGKDAHVEGDGYYGYERGLNDISVEIGKYDREKNSIEILVSGKTEINGKVYDFKAGGKLDFSGNQNFGEWWDKNRIPA